MPEPASEVKGQQEGELAATRQGRNSPPSSGLPDIKESRAHGRLDGGRMS